jgi:hypothetical protein
MVAVDGVCALTKVWVTAGATCVQGARNELHSTLLVVAGSCRCGSDLSWLWRMLHMHEFEGRVYAYTTLHVCHCSGHAQKHASSCALQLIGERHTACLAVRQSPHQVGPG